MRFFLRLFLILSVVLNFCSCNSPGKEKDPVDYVNPYMGNISHLLVPTFPTVHLPHSMLRFIPNKESYTSEQMYGIPLVTTSHRSPSSFRISPFRMVGDSVCLKGDVYKRQDGGKAAYMKAEAYNQAVIMADIDDADNFLWCFVGNETDGFQIYNKAFLENGARLISVEGGNGTAQLAPADTEWNHSWLIKDDNGLYGLLPGTATNDNYLHGTLDIGIIFYGHTATEGGCAWIFEDASQEIVVDFSALIALIEELSLIHI